MNNEKKIKNEKAAWGRNVDHITNEIEEYEDCFAVRGSIQYRKIAPISDDHSNVNAAVVVVRNIQSSPSVLWTIKICMLKSFGLIRLTIGTIFPFEGCSWRPIPAHPQCSDYHNVGIVEFATLRAFNRYGKLYISFFLLDFVYFAHHQIFCL